MENLQGVESEFLTKLVTFEHIILSCSILALLMMMKYRGPLKNTLFTEKWNWLVAPINIVLSAVGVFGLSLTTFTTLGMKVAVTLIISFLVTFSYEAVFKYAMSFGEVIVEWLRKKLNK